ncbi:MAG: Ig-like domain-containing protein, partial [Chloroflexota bacterium]|nr:Ig-like domain-containing protein [Chloroflexota bacterium]
MRTLFISRGRRFWLSLAVAAIVALGVAALGYSAFLWAGGEEKKEGTVLQMGPLGEEVSRMSPVTIQIGGRVDRDLLRRNLSLSPAVSGSATWKGDALVFEPQWPGYARGTTYAVSLATPIAAKSGLREPVSFSFTVEGKLAVEMVVPDRDSVEIALDSAVLMQFNRPVAPLTVLEEESPQGDILRFEPSVTGRGKWLTSTIYVFRPDSGLQPATQYRATVPAGVSDTVGGSLEEDYIWSFTTVSPAVAKVFPEQNSQYVGPFEAIKVTFNQAMDKASAEARFSLAAATGAAVAGSFSWPDDETLVFQPSQPLQLTTRYQATVAAGAAAAGRPEATTSEDFSWGFTSVGVPRILSTTPPNGASQTSVGNVEIAFSNPMDEESVEESIVISPPPEEGQTYTYWSPSDAFGMPRAPVGGPSDASGIRLILYFPMDYSTTYTVTIPAGSKDRYGQSLAQDFVLTFTTARRPPGVAINKAGEVGTFDAYGKPQLVVRSWNVSRLDFALYTLERQKVMDLASDWKRFHDFAPPASSLVREWSAEIPNPPLNETVLTSSDLVTGDGSRLQPGYYFARVRAAGASEDDRLMLVVTKTHLLVKRAGPQVMVWAVDMASGQPLSDLSITVYTQGGSRLTSGSTDGEGVFVGSLPTTLERWEPVFVAAERPEDASLASTAWTYGIDPWEFELQVDYSDRPYVGHIYTDRPIYRPDQTVYYKGILRLDDDASYSLPPPDASGTITILDSMGRQVETQSLTVNDFGTFAGELTLSSEAPTGYYTISLVMAGDEEYEYTASARFLVAEYRKPEFEVKVAADKEAYNNGEEIVVEVESRYFFGEPVAEAPVEWRLTSRDYHFQDPEERRYSFSDYDVPFWEQQYPSERPRSDGVAKTDSEGRLTLRLPADVSTDPLSQVFTIEATVT